MQNFLKFPGRTIVLSLAVCLPLGCAAAGAEISSLPGAYFRLLDAGSQRVEKRLNELPDPTLKAIEIEGGWRHFPNAILAPAVLFAKKHPDNPRYRDPKMLALAIRMGDLFADEDEKGTYEPRGDSDWDTYIWLEAYRVLEKDLGDKRRERWKRALLRNSTLVLRPLEERVDFPWYQSPYIGTSPNHYAQYAYLIYLCGRVFDKPDWEALGAKVLRRFAMREQSVDGYWGEHNNQGPTTGYNHLTMTPVAVYWEHSKDKDVLPALRRALDFHKYFTYPNGHPVEVINDRNRRWRVSSWGHFAFSNFPDGRRYSEFLTSFFTHGNMSMSDIGRLAQNALYYHEGPTKPIPQDAERYVYQMKVPAGIRKSGKWEVRMKDILSGQTQTIVVEVR